jgi:hypothetical protein
MHDTYLGSLAGAHGHHAWLPRVPTSGHALDHATTHWLAKAGLALLGHGCGSDAAGHGACSASCCSLHRYRCFAIERASAPCRPRCRPIVVDPLLSTRVWACPTCRCLNLVSLPCPSPSATAGRPATASTRPPPYRPIVHFLVLALARVAPTVFC